MYCINRPKIRLVDSALANFVLQFIIMQWLLLLIVLIIVFRYDQIRALITGKQNRGPEIGQKKNHSDEEDDFTDYEEIK